MYIIYSNYNAHSIINCNINVLSRVLFMVEFGLRLNIIIHNKTLDKVIGTLRTSLDKNNYNMVLIESPKQS